MVYDSESKLLIEIDMLTWWSENFSKEVRFPSRRSNFNISPNKISNNYLVNINFIHVSKENEEELKCTYDMVNVAREITHIRNFFPKKGCHVMQFKGGPKGEEIG